jgi:site-specific DNA-methyltransferase (adenine-specific)
MIVLPNATVYHGSNLDVLPTLPDNSVDSIVTDPPYELGFMGKSWDNSGIAYSVELWTECMRVLKPGGHLLAFGGSRTWHRLAVAIEDAGFEMRDSIAWLYGSGFPKSMDVSKAIDKAAGAEREVLTEIVSDIFGEQEIEKKLSNPGSTNNRLAMGDGWQSSPSETAPATPEAQKWQGWGTALKPAFEPVVVARKPLIGTVAANVLAYGTGGLNIDASRIGYQGEKPSTWFDQQERKNQNIPFGSTADTTEPSSLGRWPANIILDPYTAELLDEQSGQSVSRPVAPGIRTGNFLPSDERSLKSAGIYGAGAKSLGSNHNDSGGASRFFYVAKASKKDRNEGLEELEGQEIGAKGNGLARTCATCSASVLDGCDCPDRTFVNPTRANFHPTVKPTSLMEYLIKLVTPEGGTVLDPFTGSGSTGKAALLNGYQFIGIELTDEYLPIIEGRLKWANEQASQKEEEKNEVLF